MVLKKKSALRADYHSPPKINDELIKSMVFRLLGAPVGAPEKIFGFFRMLFSDFYINIDLRCVKFLSPEAKFLRNLASDSETIFPAAKYLASRG